MWFTYGMHNKWPLPRFRLHFCLLVVLPPSPSICLVTRTSQNVLLAIFI